MSPAGGGDSVHFADTALFCEALLTQQIVVFAATGLSAGLAALYLWPRNRGFSFWAWAWCALLSAGVFFPLAEAAPLFGVFRVSSTLFAVFTFVGALHYARLPVPVWLWPLAALTLLAETVCVVAGAPFASHLASLPMELIGLFGAARVLWSARAGGEDSLERLLAAGLIVLGVMLANDAFGDFRVRQDLLDVAQWLVICIPLALVQITLIIDRLTRTTDRESRARLDAVSAARAYRQRVNLLSEELTAGQQRTRQDLAMALHDGVCQDLAATQFILETADRGRDSVDLSLLKEAVARANESARQLLSEVGSQAWSGESVEQFAESRLQVLEAEIGLSYELDVNLALPLSDSVRVALTRALWELLANVRKHAGAGLVVVRIWTLDDRVWFSVADDGAGFDVSCLGGSGRQGFGLFSLRQQLEGLGGGFRIVSQHGEGTQVRGWLPAKDDAVQLELLGETELDYPDSA